MQASYRRPVLILRPDPARAADRLIDRVARHGRAGVALRCDDPARLPTAGACNHFAGAIVLGNDAATEPPARLGRWLHEWIAAGGAVFAEGSGAAALNSAPAHPPRAVLGWFPAIPSDGAVLTWPGRVFIDSPASLVPPPAADVCLHSRQLGTLAWRYRRTVALRFPPQLCRSNYRHWITRQLAAGAAPSALVQTGDELAHAGDANLPTFERACAGLLDDWLATLD